MDKYMTEMEFLHKFGGLSTHCDSGRMFSIVKDLILIDSPSGKEKLLSLHLEHILQGLGAENVFTDQMGNLIAGFKGGNPEGANIMLTAHMDTVSYFSGERKLSYQENGRISEATGLNLGIDDKGGVGMIVELLHNKSLFISGFKWITVVFTVREEAGWAGAHGLDENIIKPTNLILSADVPVRLLESSNPNIIVYHLSEKDPILGVVRISADNLNLNHICHNQRDGYIGGDATVFFRKGYKVIDFCSSAVKQHTKNEYFMFQGLVRNCEWMTQTLMDLSRQNRDFFLFPHPFEINRAAVNARYSEFIGRMKIDETEKIINDYIHYSDREKIICLHELSKRAGTGESDRIGYMMGIISIPSELSFNEKVASKFFRLAGDIYANSRDPRLRRAIIAYFITRLKNQRPGFGEIFSILEKLVDDLLIILVKAYSSTTRDQFVHGILNEHQYSLFRSFVQERENIHYSGWPNVRMNLIKIISETENQLTWDVLLHLFRGSIGCESYENAFITLVIIKKIDIRDFISNANSRVKSVTPELFTKYLIKVYNRNNAALKRQSVFLLGKIGIGASANFIFNLYKSGINREDYTVNEILANSSQLFNNILRYYREDPVHAACILEKVCFNIEKISDKLLEEIKNNPIDKKNLLLISSMIKLIAYENEQAINSDIFIILSMNKAVNLLEKYSFSELLRICSIIQNIDDRVKRKTLLEAISLGNIIGNEYIFNYMINADTCEIIQINDNYKKGMTINEISDYLFGDSLNGYGDVNSSEFKKNLFNDLIGLISPGDFENLFNKTLGFSIPQCGLSFPDIIISGESEGSDNNVKVIIDKISMYLPNNGRRYDEIFFHIFDRKVIGKKIIRRLYNRYKESLGKNISDIEQFKKAVNSKSWSEVENIYKLTVPFLLEAYSKEKKDELRNVLFDIFIEIFYRSNTDLNKYLLLDPFEFVKKILTSKILNLEDQFYAEYFTCLKGNHINELKKIDSVILASVANTIKLSDMRHIYGLRKNSLSKKISTEKDSAISAVLRKELSLINKLNREFFMYEYFLKKICRYKPINSGNSKDLLLKPEKNASLVFRSHVADDCNKNNYRQLLTPNSIFYKIFYGGRWKGYITMVLLYDDSSPDKALMIDVFNVSKIPVSMSKLIDKFISRMIDFCRDEGIRYLISNISCTLFSNKDYLRWSAFKYFRDTDEYKLKKSWRYPGAHFQSFTGEYNIIWHNNQENSIKKKAR